MNYRHAFHAGNFADVVKHVILARLVTYLKRKEGAFRVIDTHAGAGLYDLASDTAERTGEWRAGIGRLLSRTPPAPAAALLAPYLDAIRSVNPGGSIRKYPGSPLIVRHLLRKQDRLTAMELHPADAAQLGMRFKGDFQARVIELDGWLSLGSQLPPKEKRGLVLIDPPFEKAGEFGRMVDGLVKGYRRWPGGIYALWYPIKDRTEINAFRADLKATEIPKILDIRFEVRGARETPTLYGSGLIVVNPPFVLQEELAVLLPTLSSMLGEDGGARHAMEWLTAP